MKMKEKVFLVIFAIIVFTCVGVYWKTQSSIAIWIPFIMSILIQIYGKWRKKRKRK